MKKIMALALVAMMILASTAVFADDAAATEETVVTEVELISEDAEVEAIAEDATEEATEKATEEETVDATIIMLQINNNLMFVNDEQIELDVPAQLINDRTMVPLRAIFEALEAKVEWDNDSETVTAYRGNVSISLQIGSTSLFVNRVEKVIDVPAQLVNDRTLVPVRAISEAFGCAVTWDDATETAIIKADPVEAAEVEEVVEEETTEEVTEEATEEVTEEPAEDAATEETEEAPAEETEETTEEVPAE